MGTDVDLYKFVETLGGYSDYEDLIYDVEKMCVFINWEAVEEGIKSKDPEMREKCEDLLENRDYYDAHTMIIQ